MRFSVVYSVDVPRSESLRRYLSGRLRSWAQTEGDESYELQHLGGDWRNGKHRKFVTVLDKREFADFLRRNALFATEVQTSGVVGSSGFGWRWVPAAVFRRASDDRPVYASAVVTPIPTKTRLFGWTHRDWTRIHRVLIRMFGLVPS